MCSAARHHDGNTLVATRTIDDRTCRGDGQRTITDDHRERVGVGGSGFDTIDFSKIDGYVSLDLSKNKITDTTPIGNIKALQYLELSDNQIATVDPLADLPKLSALYIAGNKITNPAPLAKLTKLSSLDLARNQIADAQSLAPLVPNLLTLKLSENQISNLTVVAGAAPRMLLLLEKGQRIGMIRYGSRAEVYMPAGCEVTVYEVFHEPGGVLKYGIPDFRLPNDVIDAEIEKLRQLGITFECNTLVGRLFTVEQLLTEKWGSPLYAQIPALGGAR